MRKLLVSLALFLTAIFAPAQIPDAPTAWVTDTTGQFTPQQIETLSAKLKGLKDTNGANILVYVSDRLPDGMPIEDFANQAARKWRIGSSKDNSSAVYFVFKGDRKTRIEVGRGLEGVLTDSVTKQIQEQAKPLLKGGDWFGGVALVTDRMVSLAATEKFSGAPAPATQQAAAEDHDGEALLLVLALVMGGLVIVWLIRRRMYQDSSERYSRRGYTDYGSSGSSEVMSSHHDSWGSSGDSGSSGSSSWGSSGSSWGSSSDSGSSFDGGGSSCDCGGGDGGGGGD